jgi:repressor LexA
MQPTDPTSRSAAAGLTERQQRILDFVQAFQAERGYPPSIREIGEHFGIRSTNGVSDHLRALERKGFLQRSGHLSRSLTVVRDGGREPELPRATIRTSDVEVVRDDPSAPDWVDEQREFQRDIQTSQADRWPAHLRPLRRPAEREATVVRRDQPSARDQSTLVPLLGKVAAGLPLLAVEDAEETLAVDPLLLGGAAGEVFALRVVGESMIEAGILPGDLLFVRRRDTARAGEIAVVLLGGEATVKRWFPEGDVIRLQPENRTMAPIYVRRGDATQCQVVGTVVGVYRKL